MPDQIRGTLLNFILEQGYDYNTADTLESDVPEKTLRLCLQYGISAIDTSPYYS
jgi:hypothetical protein